MSVFFKQFRLFDLQRIFIPIHVGKSHWTLLRIDIPGKRIEYFDSISGSDKQLMKYSAVVKRWISDEAKHKYNMENYDLSDWVQVAPPAPQQRNGVDCGVFVTMFAHYLVDDLPLDFTQDDIPFFRRKLAADILRGYVVYRGIMNGTETTRFVTQKLVFNDALLPAKRSSGDGRNVIEVL